jgi:proline dehydrogenase
LGNRGIATVFTLLGENVESGAEVESVVQEYLTLLEAVKARALDAQISIKLTQLGLDLNADTATSALETLLEKAAETGSFVWVDMEGSSYLRTTLDLFRRVQGVSRPLGICLQAYLRSSPQDLEGLLPDHPTVRIVKGAYAEPPALAYPRRADVDAAFLALVKATVEGGGRVAAATHDGKIIEAIRAWARERDVSKDRYEFQMLYGIRSGEQERLAREGEPIRVLISYGPSWFPWYMRRLAERPANLWFVLKNVFAR